MVTTERGRARAFQLYATAVHAIIQLLMIQAALALTDGRLIYTLDDPYIHLALAESILQGEYGINAGEFASPSSSILYPLILAMGLLLGLGDWAPLAVSVPFALGATWLLAGFVWNALSPTGGHLAILGAVLLGPALVLATNAAALPLTGMEHSLHVFATVLALSGLYGLAVDPTRRASLNAVVVGTLLCATIRFEGLALALAMLRALPALGLKRPAILMGTVLILILGGYSLVMHQLGLPVFPSSVMTKSYIAARAGDGNAFGIVDGVVINIWDAVNSRWGVLMGLAAAILLAAALTQDPQLHRHRVFLLTVAFVVFAHVAAGRYGWFGRYEV